MLRFLVPLLLVLSGEAIWPMPQQMAVGTTSVGLSGWKCSDATNDPFIRSACTRYANILFKHGSPSGSGGLSTVTFDIKTSNDGKLPTGEMNEEYTLNVTSTSITIHSTEVWGALRGLETLSQFIAYNFESGSYQVSSTPISIHDFPRFKFRGMLIDTSRHYEPVPSLMALLDSLVFAKYNVLHWHIVDDQSFPLEIKKYPDMWNNAWSYSERYTQDDVARLVQYGGERGIRIIPEFDGPGHMGPAWGNDILPENWAVTKGCESKCPPKAGDPCDVPCDPTNPLTYQVVGDVLHEAAQIFPDQYIHLGGDEVRENCWSNSSRIKKWMKDHNTTSYDSLYEYYIQQAHDIIAKEGKYYINWEEVWTHFGTQLPKTTIVHVWISKKTLADVVAHGYTGILSQGWYLDHLTDTFDKMYINDPADNIPVDQQKYILGGASCMWGETVDGSDLMATVWPKAAAASERLWSAQSVSDPKKAYGRYEDFRCMLLNRGVGAGPVFLESRSSPDGPSNCKGTATTLNPNEP